jgi:hypothetical protein
MFGATEVEPSSPGQELAAHLNGKLAEVLVYYAISPTVESKAVYALQRIKSARVTIVDIAFIPRSSLKLDYG